MFNVIEPRMVENTVDLENLVMHTILERKGNFSKRDIINEVQESEFFNNSATEVYLMILVKHTINFLCGYKTLIKTENGKYFVLR